MFVGVSFFRTVILMIYLLFFVFYVSPGTHDHMANNMYGGGYGAAGYGGGGRYGGASNGGGRGSGRGDFYNSGRCDQLLYSSMLQITFILLLAP
jgi:hypothetical protein